MVTTPQMKVPALSGDWQLHIFAPYDRCPPDAGRRCTSPSASVHDAGAVFDQFRVWMPGAGARRPILVDNPATPYGFTAT